MKCLLSTMLLALLFMAAQVKADNKDIPAVAFMPDIHFHDVYADFNDGSFKGLPNSRSKDHATIRTMQAQLHSTRLFNENYFALLAALDDAAARGIKFIALPGDFSDDGQQVHLRGLQKILKHYQQKYDMRFCGTGTMTRFVLSVVPPVNRIIWAQTATDSEYSAKVPQNVPGIKASRRLLKPKTRCRPFAQKKCRNSGIKVFYRYWASTDFRRSRNISTGKRRLAVTATKIMT